MNRGHLSIEYDFLTYNKSHFDELKNTISPLFDIDIRELRQKSFVEHPLVMMVLYSSAMFFSQGFFTKIGENVGDAVGKDVVLLYSKFKQKIVDSLFHRYFQKTPLLGIKIIEPSNPTITLFFNTNSKSVIHNGMDNIKQYYNGLLGFLRQHPKKVKEATMTLGDNSITEFYFIDEENEVYEWDK